MDVSLGRTHLANSEHMNELVIVRSRRECSGHDEGDLWIAFGDEVLRQLTVGVRSI